MDKPHQPGEDCAQCGHRFDPHTMTLVVTSPVPAGCITCPEPGCTCFATWSARGRRSTPEEARAVGEAVTTKLRSLGLLN